MKKVAFAASLDVRPIRSDLCLIDQLVRKAKVAHCEIGASPVYPMIEFGRTGNPETP
jgi:hypothetical protein